MLADFRLFQNQHRARFLSKIDRKALFRAALPFVPVALIVAALAYFVLPMGQSPQAPPPEDAAAANLQPASNVALGTASVPAGRKISVFMTPEPTATVRSIRRPTEIVPTATPTPKQTYDKVQYMANGGIENGLTGWYVEPGVALTNTTVHRGSSALQIAANGGFASYQVSLSPGVTYRLFAWGSLSADGGAASIGIEFFDAYGQRLQSSEPTPLIFSTSGFVRHSLVFSLPAGAIRAQVYVWKPAGTTSFVADDISVRAYLIAPGSEPD